MQNGSSAAHRVARDVRRQLVENDVEMTSELGGPQDADVIGGKEVALVGHGVRKARAAPQCVRNVEQQRLEQRTGGFLCDRRERLEDGDAGAQERRKLPREIHDLGRLDLLLLELDLRPRLVLADADHVEELAGELVARRTHARRFENSALLVSGAIKRDVFEARHARLYVR